MWFKLTGDSRLGACASERCGGQPTWRLEADGVGSNYCSGCKEHIENEGKTKTLADDLREEGKSLARRFTHHTRPKRALSLDEAIELAKRDIT